MTIDLAYVERSCPVLKEWRVPKITGGPRAAGSAFNQSALRRDAPAVRPRIPAPPAGGMYKIAHNCDIFDEEPGVKATAQGFTLENRSASISNRCPRITPGLRANLEMSAVLPHLEI